MSQIAENRRQRGFALVITVLLLSLLILLLVALVSLTRVETSVAGNTRKFSQARQNALLGLNVALGRLQEAAGPDQRVTATAVITGVPNNNKWWTGVWDTTAPTDDPEWLVSGSPDPSFGPTGLVAYTNASNPGTIATSDDLDVGGRQARLLVGFNSGGKDSDGIGGNDTLNYVVAPTEDITAGGQTIGHFAYWIGDEGLKARVNLLDVHDPAASTPPADSIDGRFRHQAAQRTAFEVISGFEGIAAKDQSLVRVLSDNQVAFLSSGPTMPDVRARIHDLTVVSRGILTDVASGGLRLDLSPFLSGRTSPTIPTSGNLAPGVTYAAVQNWGMSAGEQSGEGFNASANPSAEIHPVVVRFTLMFGVTRRLLDPTDLRLHVMPIVAIWNPFSVGLKGADYSLDVAIPFQFSFTDSDGDTLFSTATPNPLRFTISSASFLPGECRLFSAGDWVGYSSGGANGLGGNWNDGNAFFWLLDSNIPASGAVGLSQTFAGSPPGSISLSIGGQVLQEIRTFPGIGAQDRAPADLQFTRASVHPANVVYEQMVDYGWQLAPSNGATWSAISSLSSGTVVLNADDDSEPAAVYQRAYTGCSFAPSGNASGLPFAVLYDTPHAESEGGVWLPLSLAQLQHVRPRPPTNEWEPRYLFDAAGPLGTAFWDRYFLSGVTTWTSAALTGPLPCGRIRTISPHGAIPDIALIESDPIERATGHLAVEGAFNVNSTSELAWRALFWAMSRGSDSDPDAGVTVGNALAVAGEPTGNRYPFARLAFPRTPSLNVPADGSTGDAVNSAQAWSGYRRLTEAQIEALFQKLFAKVQNRLVTAGPFASLAEFVESGIIQDSIDELDADPAPERRINPVWHSGSPPLVEKGATAGSLPGQVSQWDVLSPILPILAARSDTFLIRAYGEAVNPELAEDDPDYVQGRAWCEAVVQRLPEYVDPEANDPWESGAALVPPNDTLGRRFVIVQFRWLTPEDI